MDLKSVSAALANKSGLLNGYAAIRRRLTKSQVAILMYHRVCPKTDKWSLEPLSPQIFEKQIEYLSRNFEIISLDDLYSYLSQKKSLPQKAVSLTFDDGYKDNYQYAYPILKKYKAPSTIFIATGYIGTNKLFWWDKVNYIIHKTKLNRLDIGHLGTYNLLSDNKATACRTIIAKFKKLLESDKDLLIKSLYEVTGVDILTHEYSNCSNLSWDEVKEMSGNGVVFGAHTVNHPILVNVSLSQAKYEIVQSKKDIEEKLGKEVTSFSYPNGDFNSDVRKVVQASGFAYAVSVFPGKLINSGDNNYELSRVAVIEDSNQFNVEFCGFWGDVQGVIKWLKKQ